MKRYYFDIREGDHVAPDAEGLMMCDIDAVQQEVAQSLADMARDAVSGRMLHRMASLGDGPIEPGLVLGRRGLQLEQHRPVDLLDVDTAVLDGLDGVGEFDDLACGEFRIGVGTRLDEFVHAGATYPARRSA